MLMIDVNCIYLIYLTRYTCRYTSTGYQQYNCVIILNHEFDLNTSGSPVCIRERHTTSVKSTYNYSVRTFLPVKLESKKYLINMSLNSIIFRNICKVNLSIYNSLWTICSIQSCEIIPGNPLMLWNFRSYLRYPTNNQCETFISASAHVQNERDNKWYLFSFK